MKDTGSSKQITTMTFIGMTCALVASVRNIPDVAATSWTMIFYMLVAVLLYAFPISLIILLCWCFLLQLLSACYSKARHALFLFYWLSGLYS